MPSSSLMHGIVLTHGQYMDLARTCDNVKTKHCDAISDLAFATRKSSSFLCCLHFAHVVKTRGCSGLPHCVVVLVVSLNVLTFIFTIQRSEPLNHIFAVSSGFLFAQKPANPFSFPEQSDHGKRFSQAIDWRSAPPCHSTSMRVLCRRRGRGWTGWFFATQKGEQFNTIKIGKATSQQDILNTWDTAYKIRTHLWVSVVCLWNSNYCCIFGRSSCKVG